MNFRTFRIFRLTAGWCLAMLVLVGGAPAADVEQWGVWEVSLNGPRAGNPYLDVELSCTLRHEGDSVTVRGFHDGDGVYKVRFSPPAQGSWSYLTRSDRPELDGKSGSFTVGPPSVNNHGLVQVFQTFYFRHADGTPYHQFGTTCYAWVHQPRELQEQTLRTLAAAPFNKLRFCVFPKSYYIANKNEPDLFAFQKGANGKFDFSRPDPVFWRLFERRILDLQKLGIEADIILWHPYDRWGFSQMSDAEDDRYLRYCIARFSAYRNVWWSLANEYDFMTDKRPGGHGGNKQWEDWDRFFSVLEKEDPHHRLRGIHNGRKWYDHTKEWVTHASIQSSDMNGGVRFRARYRKPVIYDECRYEGNISAGWGNLTASAMVQRFWLGTLSGCYVGHGETYKHPQDILWWSKGGILHGQSPKRIQWLKDFMAKAPAFHELRPMGDDKGFFLLARPGEYYLLYCPDQRSRTLTLAGDRPYRVDAIDPWEMTVTPAGTAKPGEFTVSAPKPDLAFRFTPYGPGEKMRPEARPTASVTEGQPLLAERGPVGTAAGRPPMMRPRVVVLSDFPPLDVIPVGAGHGPAERRSDPDDVQSTVRFLLYSNDFDVEGLVASSATLANVARKPNILSILDRYDRVDETLRRHDPRYPTAEKLRAVTWQGRSGTYGKPAEGIVGAGKDSEASEAIIRLVDRPDPRPVWICVWGGPADLAQAIWKVRATRSPAELEHFLGKLRVYLIAKQDGSAQWLLDSFPSLFMILSERNYMGMFWDMRGSDPKLADLSWINEHIRNGHGPLGACYPESGANPRTPGVIEGDSPSFLHLAGAVRGVNDPEQPNQPGWGGRFIRRDPSRNHWFDDPAGAETVWRWRTEVQQDFARRADWMRQGPGR